MSSGSSGSASAARTSAGRCRARSALRIPISRPASRAAATPSIITSGLRHDCSGSANSFGSGTSESRACRGRRRSPARAPRRNLTRGRRAPPRRARAAAAEGRATRSAADRSCARTRARRRRPAGRRSRPRSGETATRRRRRARAARARRRAGRGRRGPPPERPRAAQLAVWAISEDCSATQPSWPSTGSSARRTSPRRGARAMIRTAGSASLIPAGTCRRCPRRPGARGQAGDRALEHVGEHARCCGPSARSAGDRSRIAGPDLVGVVGDEADQPERQLELAAQDGLRVRRSG